MALQPFRLFEGEPGVVACEILEFTRQTLQGGSESNSRFWRESAPNKAQCIPRTIKAGLEILRRKPTVKNLCTGPSFL
jgi:hypothetical protein